MNRHERRRRAAMERETRFVNEYVHHLPEVGPEAIGTPGGIIHAAYYHDDWCKIYDADSCGIMSCNCKPNVRYFAEPNRS
jgi:hypothetical protein